MLGNLKSLSFTHVKQRHILTNVNLIAEKIITKSFSSLNIRPTCPISVFYSQNSFSITSDQREKCCKGKLSPILVNCNHRFSSTLPIVNSKNTPRCLVLEPQHLLKHFSNWHQPTCLNLNPNLNIRIIFLHKRNKSKKTQKRPEYDSDSDSDEDEPIQGTRVVQFRLQSLRTDGILKKALGLARNKVETAFYEGNIRVNGTKPSKKSHQIGDHVDLIKGPSPMNPDNLCISRVEVMSVKEDNEKDEEDQLVVKVRLTKTMYVENFDANPWKKGSSAE